MITTVGNGPELTRPVTGSLNGVGGVHMCPVMRAPYRLVYSIGVDTPRPCWAQSMRKGSALRPPGTVWSRVSMGRSGWASWSEAPPRNVPGVWAAIAAWKAGLVCWPTILPLDAATLARSR